MHTNVAMKYHFFLTVVYLIFIIIIIKIIFA